MVERLIKQWNARLKVLEARMEDENLTPKQAEELAEAYNEAHWMITQLTGDKGDKRPKEN